MRKQGFVYMLLVEKRWVSCKTKAVNTRQALIALESDLDELETMGNVCNIVKYFK